MTQGERIRELRKAEKLTLEKFGDKIGIKKNSVSQIENGKNSVTEQVIKSVCREFNVSEEWLRNGEGEMFVKRTRDQEIARFIGTIQMNEADTFKRRMVSALARMTEEEWEVVEKLATNIVNGTDEDE